MKRSLLFAAAGIMAATGLLAQSEIFDPRNTTFPLPVPASASEQHTGSANNNSPAVQYSNDIIIENVPTVDQRRVRIAVAFNGWLYAAFSTVDSANNLGGITIRMSRDNGQNWSTIDSYNPSDVRYEAHDIVVAGTDTNSLVLYLVGARHNLTPNTYILFVDKYDGRTGSFIGSNYNLQNGTRRIYDVSLATDYRNPAVGASPYSVGLLYSTYSSSFDSIIFVGSMDAGANWGVRETVARTGYYFRNISLAYGKSNSASNGRYFAAWERLNSSTARTGNIYSGHSVSQVNGAWNTPVNLDSVSSTMIGLCRNPQIAVQYNNVDNDSSSCTAVVLVERDYSANGTDYDLLGFYNKRSHFTNFWYRLDVVNTGENDLHPDITFDPGYNNFLAVYYDSTNGKLPYLVNEFNLANPSTWTPITPQYNDQTTNLKAAWPRVEINPLVNQTAHAWIAENGTKGVAMFDGEYVSTGVNAPGAGRGGMIQNVYPNPAQDILVLNWLMPNNGDAVITVYDALGNVVTRTQKSGVAAGEYNEYMNVAEYANGIYILEVYAAGKTTTSRFAVSH